MLLNRFTCFLENVNIWVFSCLKGSRGTQNKCSKAKKGTLKVVMSLVMLYGDCVPPGP